jgi:hypothetical protein
VSLFQCDKCGVIENTACTFGYIGGYSDEGWQADERLKRGLAVRGKYCSKCFDGEWHGRFPQRFYEVGKLHTDNHGNIGPRDYEKYRVGERLEEEKPE